MLNLDYSATGEIKQIQLEAERVFNMIENLKQRPALLIAGVIGLIILGALAWWLGSPLFINNVVDESFPSAEELRTMSEEEKAAIADEVMTTAANASDTVMDESMPGEDKPLIVSQGQFVNADDFHRGSGTATIYQQADGSHVLRFENFNVINGPDLHVLLTSNPNPTSSSEVMENYIDLGALKGNVGNQNYDIPAGTEVSQFKAVVIYCLPFHVIFSTATLG